jgi:DNA-binding MarR family transcriptional regulator
MTELAYNTMSPKVKKIGTAKTMKALALWQGATIAALKELPIDLSTRQMALLLTVHLEAGPHSVKTLSKKLSISKPALCRATDVLENDNLLRRASDRSDKRNILIMPTAKGSAFLHEFAMIIVSVSKDMA